MNEKAPFSLSISLLKNFHYEFVTEQLHITMYIKQAVRLM